MSQSFAPALAALLTVPALLLLGATLPAAGQAPAPTILVGDQPLRTDASPLLRQGALLLPMRAVFEALGAQVRWHPQERKLEARRADDLLELWVGTPVAQVNHSPVQLATPPLLVNGRTYVPLRLPVEAFGGSVRWDADSRTARIAPPE